MDNKLSALFDAREVQIDIDEKVANNLQRVESKVDKLEWRVLRNNPDIPMLKKPSATNTKLLDKLYM